MENVKCKHLGRKTVTSLLTMTSNCYWPGGVVAKQTTQCGHFVCQHNVLYLWMGIQRMQTDHNNKGQVCVISFVPGDRQNQPGTLDGRSTCK